MAVYNLLFCMAIVQITYGQITSKAGQYNFNNLQTSQSIQNAMQTGVGVNTNGPVANQIARMPSTQPYAANVNSNHLPYAYNPNNMANLGNNNFVNGQNLPNYVANKAQPYQNYGQNNLQQKAANYQNVNLANQMPNSMFSNNLAAGNYGGLPTPLNQKPGYGHANGNNMNGYPSLANSPKRLNPGANVINSDIGTDMASGGTLHISGYPFSIMTGDPSYDFHVTADGLEIGGKVTVSGKMPFYGTVSLSGNVPTDGAGTVLFGCPAQ